MPSFMDLPPEIRLQIYPHLLDPSSYISSYKQINRLTNEARDNAEKSRTIDRPSYQIPDVTLPRFHVTRYTPSILLVNRQITSEALPILYKKELKLQGTPWTYFVFRQMDIAEFISETLLQRVQSVVLRLESPNKLFILSLLDIWGRENALRKLVLYLPTTTAIQGQISMETQVQGWNWNIVNSRLQTFTQLERIPYTVCFVDNPLDHSQTRCVHQGPDGA
ncbi:hypothetical protein BJX99DRAFT_228677 [Aspergillus californicus]